MEKQQQKILDTPQLDIPQLDIIVPCYNEMDVLAETSTQLLVLFEALKKQKLISVKSHIYFIDDGSRDNTWSIIANLTYKHECIEGIKLNRNYGHQNALLAGLFSVRGDYVISLDADLQDNIKIIEQMLEAATHNDIVYAARKKRETDSLFKKYSAILFYKLMGLLGCELVPNHADYRLLSRKAIEHLKTFKETNLFLRGLVPLLGFNSSIVYYDRLQREAGKSKYSLFKMISFAWTGITSLSIAPLRMITLIGFIIFIASLVMGGWGLYVRFFTQQAIPGWASTILPIYFIGGVQLLSIGIIGEYIGKIYMETKQRPRYFIENRTDDKIA